MYIYVYICLYGRKPPTSAKRKRAMAPIPEGKATASAAPAPPLGPRCVTAPLSDATNGSNSTPRPRVRVTKEDAASSHRGVIALSKSQVAASRALQLYAQRGIIRVASNDAGSHRAETNMHVSTTTSKRRCTGKGVTAPSATFKRRRVGDDPPGAKRHCGNQHIAACSSPRPPESGVR